MGDGGSILVLLLLPLMGVAAYIGLHHLWLWSGRGTEPLHPWVAAWSASSLLLLIGYYLQDTAAIAAGALLGARLAWTAGFCLVVVVIGLSHALAGRAPPLRIMIPATAVNVALVGMLWLSEAIVTARASLHADLLGHRYWMPDPGPLVVVLLPYFLLVFVSCVVVIWRGSGLSHGERKALLMGLSVYIALAVNDVLHIAGLIRSVRVFSLGFVAVAVGLTYLLVRRYNRLRMHLREEVAARTRELDAQRERQAALVRSGQALMAGLDLSATLQHIVVEAARMAGTPHVRVMLLDRDARVLRQAASAGAPVPAGLQVPLGESLSGRVAITGQPLVVGDVQNDPRSLLGERDRQAGITTYLGLPIRKGTEVLGVLTLNTEQPHEWSAGELAVLSALADQAALAIDNARRYGSELERSRELEALREVQTALVSRREIASVLDAIAAWAVRLIGARGAVVFELDRRDGLLHPRAMSGVAGDMPRIPLRPGQGGAGAAVRTRQPVWSPDIRSQPLPGYTDEAQGQGRPLAEVVAELPFRALLAVPIIGHEDALGAIAVAWGEVHVPVEREVRLLTVLAEHAALALTNAYLYEELEERLARLETLTRLNRLISSSLDPDTVLREIAGSAASLMKVSVVWFWRADAAARTLTAAGCSDAEMQLDWPLRSCGFDEGAAGWVATHRRALHIPDVSADGRLIARDWMRAHGLKSFYGVPVVHDGTLLAVLTLHSTVPFQWSAAEERLLEGFVAQAAVALRHAQLYQGEAAARREAELALAQVRQLQGMLPICAYCKKIRNDRDYWESIESYLGERSQATFSHGICPECRDTIVKPELEQWRREQSGTS